MRKEKFSAICDFSAYMQSQCGKGEKEKKNRTAAESSKV